MTLLSCFRLLYGILVIFSLYCNLAKYFSLYDDYDVCFVFAAGGLLLIWKSWKT